MLRKEPIIKQEEYFKTFKNLRCPNCEHKLQKKHEGMACLNHKCCMFFKLGRGWIFLDRKKEDSILFFTSEYDFNPENFKNKKKWLRMKSEILYEKGCCEICSNDRCLHVHHIMPRSSHPELAMDKENLMVLCEDCHKKYTKEISINLIKMPRFDITKKKRYII